MSRKLLFVSLLQGDVLCTYDDNTKVSLADTFKEVAKAHDLPYSMEFNLRNDRIHVVLPDAHFEKTPKGETSHKGYIGSKLLTVTYEALLAAGFSEDNLNDHTIQTKGSETKSDVGIWINGVTIQGAQAGTGVAAGPAVDEQLVTWTERFTKAGGDLASIPAHIIPNNALCLSYVRTQTLAMESKSVAAEIQKPATETQLPATETKLENM